MSNLEDLIAHTQEEIDKRIQLVDEKVQEYNDLLASDLSETYKDKIREDRLEALKNRSDWEKEREKVVKILI